MINFTVSENSIVFSDGRLIEIKSLHPGIRIIGLNREREIVSNRVTQNRCLSMLPGYHIWSTKGDGLFDLNSRMITPNGPKSLKNIKEMHEKGHNFKIEMPSLGKISYGLKEKGSVESIVDVMRLSCLKENWNGQMVVKIPSENLDAINNLIKKIKVKVENIMRGGKWSWIAIRNDSYESNRKKGNNIGYELWGDTLKIARLLTCFSEEEKSEYITGHEQRVLRLIIILGFHAEKIPFEMSVLPVSCPLEIRLFGVDKWQPYARLFSVSEEEGVFYKLELENDQFTPLINNFMVLS